jgi:hypothetical protein
MEAACLHGEHEDMGLVVLEVGRKMVASGCWIGLQVVAFGLRRWWTIMVF